jgi:hypothetical protein
VGRRVKDACAAHRHTEEVMITVAGYTRGEGWGSGHGRRHRRRASGDGRRGVIDAWDLQKGGAEA